MILEIAIGIVLGFILLANLDLILSLGFIAVGIAIALIALFFVIYGVGAALSNLPEILEATLAIAGFIYGTLLALGLIGILTEKVFAFEGTRLSQIAIERPILKNFIKNHNEVVKFFFDKCGYGTWLLVILLISGAIFIGLTESLYATITLMLFVLVAINLYRTHITNNQRSFMWLIGYCISKFRR